MPALNTSKNKKNDGKLGSKVFRAKVMEEKKVRSTSQASRTSTDSFEKIVNIESVGVKSKNSTKMQIETKPQNSILKRGIIGK